MRRHGALLLTVLAIAWLVTSTRSQQTPEGKGLDDRVFRTVVIGDSVARGAGDEKGLGIAGWLARELHPATPNAAVPVNLGLDGARAANVIRLLGDAAQRSAVAEADLIVLSIGGNDLYGDAGARLLSGIAPWYQREKVGHRVERLVKAIQHVNPHARVYVLGLYNPYRTSKLGAWLDEQVNLWDARLTERFAAEQRVTVLRVADLLARADRLSTKDHFHPGTLGYAAIARRITEGL